MSLKVWADWAELPNFSSVEEEAAFWAENQMNTEVLQRSLYKGAGTESTAITLRMDPRMLARLKRLAAERYLNYQSMLKQWLAERLEKEMEGR